MTVVPALYDVTVRHARIAPVRHNVTARSYLWFVDLDALPSLPRPLGLLARFRAADHLGDPQKSLRQNIDALLTEHGLELAGGRVLMLAAPRVLGHVFNPLSIFWCHRPDGSLACVVAEVHNTYGGRHAYILHPDDKARAAVAKRFYVSPFFPVDGHYTMSLAEPNDRLNVVITLHLPDAPPFVASIHGERRPATLRQVLRLGLRHPVVTRATAVKIRWHGVRLWLRRVPIVARPSDAAGHASSAAHRPPVGGPLSHSKELTWSSS